MIKNLVTFNALYTSDKLSPHYRITLLYFFACILLGCHGCIDDPKGPKEGIITYDITYPKPAADPFDQQMMPSEMTMKFKNDKSLTTLNFGMGFIKMTYLSDNENKTITELNKFMGKKRAYIAAISDLDYLLKDVPPYKIHFIEKQDTVIATYKCKKAIVHVQSKEPYDFVIYYTKDIELKDPNWCTPFKEIKGVLMEYQVEQYNIIMRFTAKKVELIEQDDADFTMPSDFKVVSRKDMDEIHKMLKEMND